MELKKDLAPGMKWSPILEEQFYMECQFPGIQNEQPLTGIIKNICGSNENITLGIAFTDLTQEVLDIIEDYIFAIQKIFE